MNKLLSKIISWCVGDNILLKIWNFFPNSLQTFIKFFFVKMSYYRNFSYWMCKIITFQSLIEQNIKIWKWVTCPWYIDMPIVWFVEIWDYTQLSVWNMFYSSKEYKITIWKFCSIGNGASFIASMNHNMNYLTTSTKIKWNFENVWWDIIIGNDVWIWKNAIILKGVTIWTWAIIWAWSIVTKDVPPYAIAVWNPAKVIKYRFNKKTIDKLLESEWWLWDIDKIKKNYNLEFINL